MKKIIIVDDMKKLILNVSWQVWLSTYLYNDEMIEILEKNNIDYHIIEEESVE